jgi:predicted nucleic-acid-binding protein
MVSIDTNILIRLLTGDDKSQAAKAKRLFVKEHVYITKTVVLEAEWVLRYAYEFSAEAIAKAFVILLGQDNVTVEDSHHIAQATTLLQNGMDFADALHLTCSRSHLFFTFDKKLVSKASTAGLNAVRLL